MSLLLSACGPASRACGSQAVASLFPHMLAGVLPWRLLDASCIALCRCVCKSYGSGCLLLPSLITGSSNTPRVQRLFMLTEHFSARNTRLNKLESSPRRKQKMEGEERHSMYLSVLWKAHRRGAPQTHSRARTSHCWGQIYACCSTLDVNGLLPRLPTFSKFERHSRGFLVSVLASVGCLPRDLLRTGFTLDLQLFSLFHLEMVIH